MIIGRDFEKIEFSLWGLQLLEPNNLITNFILFTVCMLSYYKVRRINQANDFFRYWGLFYLFFGLSFMFGGLGHGFYNYLGVHGKYAGLLISIGSIYFLERAMLNLLKHKQISFFIGLSKVKLVSALIVELVIFMSMDLKANPQIGLLTPSISSAIGFLTCLGYLPYRYKHQFTRSFKYFYWSLIVFIPNAFIQGMKISFLPWFDRNDLSHILILIMILLQWKGIKGYLNYKITLL